jgi:hypothetical protein
MIGTPVIAVIGTETIRSRATTGSNSSRINRPLSIM